MVFGAISMHHDSDHTDYSHVSSNADDTSLLEALAGVLGLGAAIVGGTAVAIAAAPAVVTLVAAIKVYMVAHGSHMASSAITSGVIAYVVSGGNVKKAVAAAVLSAGTDEGKELLREAFSKAK
jgi:hypothetical protein